MKERMNERMNEWKDTLRVYAKSQICASLFSPTTELQHQRLQGDVASDEQLRSECLRQPDPGRGPEGEDVEGQVRLPPRVDDERLPQPEEALQHHEGRQQLRLEGVRCCNAHRSPPKVRHSDEGPG